MPNTRIHLGYKECVKCSKVEPYHAHVVYPHKTGAFVQPVTKEQKEYIQSVDRRAVKTKRTSTGGSSSWDRWLKQFNEQKNAPSPKRRRYRSVQHTYQKSSTVLRSAEQLFKDKGYHTAIQYVDTLYADDKISLIQKSNINSKLAFIQQHNKKQRRILGF